MENQDDDHPSQESIQEQETADDQQQQQQEVAATSPVRSYDCTFCKRGFSNAQALGGHMNIHRKDKAKLKQTTGAASSKNPQSINISKIRAFMDPVFSIRPSMEFMSSTTTTAATAAVAAGTQRPNWILGVENDAAKMDKTQLGEVRKLPLFVERSPPPPPLKIDPTAAGRSPGKDMAPSSSEEEEEEEEEDLDLELRLGPEPHQDSSSSATGTKKFF